VLVLLAAVIGPGLLGNNRVLLHDGNIQISDTTRAGVVAARALALLAMSSSNPYNSSSISARVIRHPALRISSSTTAYSRAVSAAGSPWRVTTR
jgi:hypothetical protein